MGLIWVKVPVNLETALGESERTSLVLPHWSLPNHGKKNTVPKSAVSYFFGIWKFIYSKWYLGHLNVRIKWFTIKPISWWFLPSFLDAVKTLQRLHTGSFGMFSHLNQLFLTCEFSIIKSSPDITSFLRKIIF